MPCLSGKAYSLLNQIKLRILLPEGSQELSNYADNYQLDTVSGRDAVSFRDIGLNDLMSNS